MRHAKHGRQVIASFPRNVTVSAQATYTPLIPYPVLGQSLALCANGKFDGTGAVLAVRTSRHRWRTLPRFPADSRNCGPAPAMR
jgi:hypothetical protein